MNFDNIYQFIISAFSGMQSFFNLKMLGAFILGVYLVLLGQTDPLIIESIIILIGIDFITGVSASLKEGKTVTSALAFRTPLKAFFYTLIIIAAHQVGVLIPTIDTFIIGSLSGFLGVNEMISVVENFGRMGYSTPKKLLNQLHQFND